MWHDTERTATPGLLQLARNEPLSELQGLLSGGPGLTGFAHNKPYFMS